MQTLRISLGDAQVMSRNTVLTRSVIDVANRRDDGASVTHNSFLLLVKVSAFRECEEYRVPVDFDICALPSKRLGARTLCGTVSRVD